MQFNLVEVLLVPENGPEFCRRYEENFCDVLSYIMSLPPPTPKKKDVCDYFRVCDDL